MFDKIIPIILEFEGGLVDNKNDTGGITNFGISLNFAKLTKDLELFDINKDGIIDREDIKLLTKERAIKIYKKYFWDEYKLESYNSNRLAFILFDMYVNHNPKSVNRMLQTSVNRCKSSNFLEIDGVIGSKSIEAINQVDKNELCQVLLCERE